MNNDLHFASKTNEHYTPMEWVDRIDGFLEGIDLDPCSNSLKCPHVPALKHFTKEDDGLSRSWAGRVFVNPPYGRGLKSWAQKAVTEFNNRHAEEIIFLAPFRSDTAWFHCIAPHSTTLAIRGRLKFVNPGNKDNSAPFPSALFYLGDRWEAFAKHFGDYGLIMRPYK